MSAFRTFSIGSAESCDIRIERSGIAYRHAEIVVARSGALHLTDCGSEHGSWRRAGEDWAPLRQDYVEPDEPLRLGPHETTAQALLSLAASRGSGGGGNGDGGTPRADPPRGRVRRIVETGEVIAVRDET